MNEKEMAQQNQANAEKTVEIQAKTIVNGKEVTLKEAQEMADAAARQTMKTGIQAHHDNSSEAVAAGEVGSNTNVTEQSTANVKQSNMQSGQSHLAKDASIETAQARAAQQAAEQAAQQQAQQAAAKAKAKKAEQ